MEIDLQDQKAVLVHYLGQHRDALRWKLDGLSEHDVRRPLVDSGTNLLGLLKHTASVTAGYFGDVFGRPFGEDFPWFAPDAEPNADMFATADESRTSIEDLYERAWAHADATWEALDLTSPGHVPWWGMDVTLHVVMVHMLAELARHCGHADLVREMIDGDLGTREDVRNLPALDAAAWSHHRDQLQTIADGFA